MKRSSKLIGQLVGFIAGLGKAYPTPTTLQLNDGAVSTADLARQFQAVVDADAQARAKEIEHRSAVATANALAEQAAPVAQALKGLLLALHGGNATALAVFSLEPRKVGEKSAEVKSAAALKAAATRKALGTKGARQKKVAKKLLAAPPAAEPAPPAPAAPAAPPKS